MKLKRGVHSAVLRILSSKSLSSGYEAPAKPKFAYDFTYSQNVIEIASPLGRLI